MRHRTSALALVLALLISMTACPSNNQNSNLTPEQKVEKQQKDAEKTVEGTVKGVRIVSTVIDTGIGTATDLTRAGKLKRDKALKLAQGARLVNSATKDLTKFLLSEDSIDSQGRVKVQELINAIFDSAKRFEDEQRREGMTKDDSTLVFDLGLTSGRLAAQIAFDEFGSQLPEGFILPITSTQKERLRTYLKTLESNSERLDEAIVRLSN